MTAAEAGPGRIRMGPGGEFDVIRSILNESREPGEDVLVGPGDDALVLEGGWVLTCDLSVEDVHFRKEWLGPEEIGYRAGAAALSDLAAMAAGCVGVLTSIATPPEDGGVRARAVAAGVREAVESVGGALLGGDLTASPGPLVVDVIAVGRTETPVGRAGAAPGDRVWVTGALGGAAGAVRDWREGRVPSPDLREAFARPSPRIEEARWLAEAASPSALVDVSDGLAGDAGHLAAAGGVKIVLEADAIPVRPDLSTAGEGEGPALELALHGGEDYELLFTGAEELIGPLATSFEERFGIPLTPVGRVEAGDGVFLEVGAPGSTREVVRIERGGYNHFPRASGPTGGEDPS